MPFADFSHAVKVDCSPLSQFPSHATSQGTWETSQGKTRNFQCINAGFIKHTPLRMEDFVPDVPHLISGSYSSPCIFGLGFLAQRRRLRRVPDPASRRRPCPSPNLRLRLYPARGLSPRLLCTMPGTHGAHQRCGGYTVSAWMRWLCDYVLLYSTSKFSDLKLL